MSDTRYIVWGAGGHALVVADALEAAGHAVHGFIDEVNPGRTSCRHPAPVLGGRDILKSLGKNDRIALGFGINRGRLEVAQLILQSGLSLATVIHPSAVIAGSATIGEGAFIGARAVIQTFVTVGRCAIVNTAATVDHECQLDPGAQIGPGAHLAGNVYIATCATIGIGTSIRERMMVGEDAFIGAGSVVVSDIPAKMLAFGNPAKVVKGLQDAA